MGSKKATKNNYKLYSVFLTKYLTCFNRQKKRIKQIFVVRLEKKLFKNNMIYMQSFGYNAKKRSLNNLIGLNEK